MLDFPAVCLKGIRMKNLPGRAPAVVAATVIAALLAAPEPSSAAREKSAAKAKSAGPKYARMDYGPFLAASILSDPRAKVDNSTGAISGDSTARGIAIKLSDDWESGVVFDADLL